MTDSKLQRHFKSIELTASKGELRVDIVFGGGGATCRIVAMPEDKQGNVLEVAKAHQYATTTVGGRPAIGLRSKDVWSAISEAIALFDTAKIGVKFDQPMFYYADANGHHGVRFLLLNDRHDVQVLIEDAPDNTEKIRESLLDTDLCQSVSHHLRVKLTPPAVCAAVRSYEMLMQAIA